MLRINGGRRGINGAQAVNVTLAKQVAAFHHFIDQLFKADALPFTFAAFTDAFHRLKNTQRAVQAFQLRRAPGAGRRASIKTVLACQLRHRRAEWH